MNVQRLLAATAAVLLACQPTPTTEDAGTDGSLDAGGDAGLVDAGPTDAGTDGGVEQPNTAPVFGAVDPITLDEGTVVTLTLEATDAEQDPVTFSIQDPPAFVTLTAGTLRIAPDGTHAGSYQLALTASDGELTDHLSVSLTVLETGVIGSARNLTAPTSPTHPDLRQVTNGSGTLVISRQFNGLSSVLTWAHRSPTGWTTGVLGEGSFDAAYQGPPAGQLITWGDRFVAVWNDLQKVRRWAIFEDGAWRFPSAAPPLGSIAGYGELLAEGVLQLGTPNTAAVSFYDGLSWSPPETLSGASSVTSVSVHPSGGELLLAWFDSSIYVSGSYRWTLRTRRYQQPTWLAEETVREVQVPSWASNDVSVPLAHHNGTTWLLVHRASSTGTAEVRSPGTGAWSTLTLENLTGSLQLVARGAHTAIANSGNGRGFVRVHDGSQWLSGAGMVDQSGVGMRVASTPTGFVAVYPYGGNLESRSFDPGAGTWSVAERAFNNPSTPPSIGGVVASGEEAMITFVFGGISRAAVRSGGAWTAHVLHPGVSLGLPQPIGVAGLEVLYPEERSVRLRSSSGGSLAAPVELAPAVFGGTALPYPNQAPKIAGAGGKALAVWDQYDAGSHDLFAAFHDGNDWGAPFKVLASATLRGVATNGTSFVISAVSTGPGGGIWGRLIRWSESDGLGTPLTLGSGNPSLEDEVQVASNGSDYLAVWTHHTGAYNHFELQAATSPDGISWSGPEVISEVINVYSTPWWTVSLAGSPAGYVMFAKPADNLGGFNRRARVLIGGSWSVDHPVSGDCRPAAGSQLALLCNEGNAVTAQLHSPEAWSSTTLHGAGITGGHSLAASATGLRATYGSWTRTWDETAGWSAEVELPGLSSTSLASDGSEYLGVGAVADSGAPDLRAWRSGSGVLRDDGLLEASPGAVGSPSVTHDGVGYRAIWPQVDASGLGREVIVSDL